MELGSTDIARDRENYLGCSELLVVARLLKKINTPEDRKIHVSCSEMSVESRSVEPSSTVHRFTQSVVPFEFRLILQLPEQVIFSTALQAVKQTC